MSNNNKKALAILGSTGSIGVSTLDIVASFPERYRVVCLTAGSNIRLLREQIVRFRPKRVAVADDVSAELLRHELGHEGPEILCGVDGLVQCATHPEVKMVVSAIVGAAGLVPTMAAVSAGKDIALANKEILVAAGELFMAEVARQGVQLIPVDSEHSAIFQSLAGQRSGDVRRLILTASGGPFRTTSMDELQRVCLKDALAHPNWEMGKKITIDSATMMNKGLEVIEARWLFDLPAEQIAVHIHPQSIVHSLVEYCDGALIAQLGIPDMKTPIAYALSWPERLHLKQKPLDLCLMEDLSFSEPDLQRFPCLSLAYQALERGGTCPAVMNAANEIAVAAFLQEKIGFLQIPQIIAKVMLSHEPKIISALEQVLEADLWGRRCASDLIEEGVNR
ncbi:1-deoxy-D-xylulose-5-phosphate reductoisomerase [Geopsychrobacter electrodiphilus]|uniref:1-deoxy-D-xylulose-5-phosphate reductoisomerase n=1 Tax=Geopsychrobacter electrodiphilus TaxID=225196 RepID=UPI00036E0072|nr:1-deoxy-D-xylulose-5-phosphate reductoisomerase [Geopsychrobacter electrodiphilus]